MKAKLEGIKLNKSTLVIVGCAFAVVIIALAGILWYMLFFEREIIDLQEPPLDEFINVNDNGTIGAGATNDSIDLQEPPLDESINVNDNGANEDGTTNDSIDLPKPPPGEFINVKDKGAIGDGTTNDSSAITIALNEAQSKGIDLYFPAGTYNFSGVNFNAQENIRIFGDGESSILYDPGTLNCYGDVSLENLAVMKRNGIFVSLRLARYVDVFINNVTAYNDLPVSDNAMLVSAFTDQLGTNTGINNVVFTNNKITKFRSALALRCEIKSGLIDNNTLTHMGDPGRHQTTLGMAIGNIDSAGRWIEATNVTISNNTIKEVHGLLPQSTSYLVYSILAIGNNINIINNHIENQNSFTGIYAKANELLISGNTLINAGYQSSIVIKVSESDSDGSYVVVDNNNITSSIDWEGSIRVQAVKFVVSNNTIRQYDNAPIGLLSDGASIFHSSYGLIDGIIEGNDIYTEAKYAILLNPMTDKVIIRDNDIVQNIVAPEIYTGAAAISFRGSTATSEADIINNKITVQRGLSVLQGSSTNSDGSIINFTSNEVTAPEGTTPLFSPYYMTLHMVQNRVFIESSSAIVAGQGKGLLSAQETSVINRIESNEIHYSGNGTSNLFSFKTPFSFTNNMFTFRPGSDVVALINYLPVINEVPTLGAVTTITNNSVGNIPDVLSGDCTPNIDNFIQFNSTASYIYPALNIVENSVIVKLRLLGKSSITRGIGSIGSINVNRNFIYSPLYSGDAAVIDLRRNDANLHLGANTSLTDHVAA